MDKELSIRFRTAIDFVQKNGYARNDTEIAKRIGVQKSSLCMAANGTRVPSWGMLLDFCDAYPVNFWWLRSGEGGIVRGERELALLRRIEELEKELKKK